MSGHLVYSDGDPSIVNDNCRARRIKYADHLSITRKDNSVLQGQFLGTECADNAVTLLLSRNTATASALAPDTQRVELSSVAEIRYADPEYATSRAAIILGVVGVLVIIGLAGGGAWLTIPD